TTIVDTHLPVARRVLQPETPVMEDRREGKRDTAGGRGLVATDLTQLRRDDPDLLAALAAVLDDSDPAPHLQERAAGLRDLVEIDQRLRDEDGASPAIADHESIRLAIAR